MSTYECQQCHRKVEYEPCFLEGRERFRPRICGDCTTLERKAQAEAQAQRKQAELVDRWKWICPPSYALTDPNFPLMNHELLAGLMRWEPGADGKGIGLYGETGMRKTRMMFLLLKKLHFSGVNVFAVSSKRLAQCFSLRFGKDNDAGKAKDVIRKCLDAEVLFMDDLGKQKFSTDGESEFFHLIEDRTSRLKPILWTANATGDELAAMMSPDKGGPIVRRLVDFSEVIGV